MGFTWIRTAGFCPPLMLTRPTPGSCEILGAELAGWMLKNPGLVPNPNGTDLPLRKQVEDIFNLRNRCAVLGVSTLLIAVDGNRKGKYFWHERSQQVAVNPGARSVVPSDTVQPF